MVAMVDPNDNSPECQKDERKCKRIETKIWMIIVHISGEVSRSGKPTKQWTGPTEGSAWLKEQSNQEFTAADIQKIDLELQRDKINQLTAKKNNDALSRKERTAAGNMIKYVKQKMKFIMNFGEQTKNKQNNSYKQWKDKAMPFRGNGIGSMENNKFLYNVVMALTLAMAKIFSFCIL